MRVRFVRHFPFNASLIRSEVEESGFEVKEIYSNFAGERYDSASAEMALVAEKS